MYAGHFAIVLLLHSYDPTVNSFLLTFGVVFIDIIMAVLAYFSIEGFEWNPKASGHGIELYIPISHSLLTSVLFSCLWACFNLKHFQILFISSFSHLVLDWFVHNHDLELYPFSNCFIGGTQLSSKYPRLTFYLELVLCIFCTVITLFIDTHIDLCLIFVILYLLYLQCYRALSIDSELFSLTQISPKEKQGPLIFQSMFKAFVIPAIIFGTLLELRRFI